MKFFFLISFSYVNEMQYILLFYFRYILNTDPLFGVFIQLYYNRKNDYITLFTVCKYDYEIYTAVRYKNSVNIQKPNVT